MEDFIKQGSGNVYKDMGYDDAESMKIKADIVSRISDIMEERKLTQKKVADITGIPQGRISNILNGQFRGVSEYKLLACLSLLGNNIEIKIVPTNGEQGKIVFA
ncbi:MAG: helix-turn-helix transcriptional regulator [Desulfovibrio fairfieldensis]|nr:helix-turn-helix transcriptional regulator [Desulfovibrio fairfieldensis]